MFHSDSEVRMSENMSTKDSLNDAAREGNIDLLYTLIQQDPDVLENIDKIPFVETPLHVAVDAGHLQDAGDLQDARYLQFAVEIMMLKPSFASKRNPQGLCPIHLALQSGQKRMVLRFVEINKDLVRVKGREGITPLHLASQNEYVDLLREFLEACPDSIEDVTMRSETALHVAVKNHQYDALKHLTQWLKKNVRKGATELEKTILNQKDEEGNTILHISALSNDSQVRRWLDRTKMDLRAKNAEGKTASDIAGSPEIKSFMNAEVKCKSVRDVAVILKWMISHWNTFVHASLRRSWNLSEEQRNSYLVVATLIASATYQAALSPPGGLYQADPGTDNTLSHLKTVNSSINRKPTTEMGGNSVMTGNDFIAFSDTNMCSFFTSTFAILLLLPKNCWWFILFFPTVFLQLSYFFSMMVISPTPSTTSFVRALYLFLMVVGYICTLLLFLSIKLIYGEP